MRIRLTSTLAVDRAERTLSGQALGSRKARTLLALVSAARGALVPLDRLVEALWPQGGPADPGANVATLASRTRRLLGADLLDGVAGGYRLAPDGAWAIDLDEAGHLLTAAEGRALAGEPLLAVAAARSAHELLGDTVALADEGDAPWVLEVRREADALRRRARHLLAESLARLDPAAAVAVAESGVVADPFDERAVRDLIRALVADGRTAAALSAFDSLAARLREELGTDADRETSALHLAVLREAAMPAEAPPERVPERPALVGREPELARAEAAWAALADPAGPRLLVVEGEAGIGKTRLLEAVGDIARSTGGRTLGGRCHPAERSLFLQPFLDALRPPLLAASPAGLHSLVEGHTAAWASLVPELAPVLPPGPALPADVDLQRRAAHDAIAAALHRLALSAPVLLTVDDLQDGGTATVDLLGYLATRLRGSRVLVVAAVRAEEAHAAARLRDRSTVLRLGALPRSAVEELARSAGLAEHGAQVMARTGGPALSVVESLRALSLGDSGIPASLAEAVGARVERLGAEHRTAVEAAAVLRRRLDPALLAALLETNELGATRLCEELVRSRLLVRSGPEYEFANDLLQECVYAALPPALAAAYHRRIADLTADRPELMAEHAAAAGDRPRAALGWLMAGRAALRRAATEDALALLGRSLGEEDGDGGPPAERPPGVATTGDAMERTRGRALLARAEVREARAEFAEALADIDSALAIARATGDRRLEMAALRARGGDSATGLGLEPEALAVPLESGLHLAEELGDRRAEADFSSRLVILEASRLRLGAALARAERSVARARSARSEDALVLALDGLKTVWAYLGDPVRLGAVVRELEPLVRARDDRWLLQWVVLESSVVAAAEGRWADARSVVAEALDLNQRIGYPAYTGYLRAHDGWFARLSGDLDAARLVGRRSLEEAASVSHPWWTPVAAGFLAATLVESGDPVAAEDVARRGLATAPVALAGGRERCMAALAAVGDEGAAGEATRLLDAVDCPPGQPWVAGADCYLLLADAALRRGDRGEVRRLLMPLRQATRSSWEPVRTAVDALLAQNTSATSRAARSAPSDGTGT